jgi:hypothetical protein
MLTLYGRRFYTCEVAVQDIEKTEITGSDTCRLGPTLIFKHCNEILVSVRLYILRE